MRRNRALALGGVVVVVAVAIAAFALRPDRDARTTGQPATTVTTLGPASSSSSTASTAPDFSAALYPDTTMTQRFSSPAEVARSFATRYLDMPSPEVGAYRAGEPRAGEVPVRAKPGRGPTTVVVVRQLAGGADWFVTAASSENLQLDTPDPFDVIRSPVSISGRSRAFEAHVNVGVREDGQLGPDFLGKGFYTGGSSGPDLGPFTHSQDFRAPTKRLGSVVLLVYSAEDGSVAEATVVRVRFATA
jgi:hypothetical protein